MLKTNRLFSSLTAGAAFETLSVGWLREEGHLAYPQGTTYLLINAGRENKPGNHPFCHKPLAEISTCSHIPSLRSFFLSREEIHAGQLSEQQNRKSLAYGWLIHLAYQTLMGENVFLSFLHLSFQF